MAETAEGLEVREKQMRASIEATRGAIFAERAMMLLAEALGRDAAHTLVEKAAKQSATEGRHLAEALAEIPEVTKILDAQALRDLETPQAYLGVTEELRKRLRSAKQKG
jgi:3-carboxy-cis,cis-muconate cycloisomerase